MEAATATLPSGSRFEDRYEIVGELGSGSFGRVYSARQLSTGQSVAIKLLAARAATESSTGREADRFRRETRICAALSHPNVVQLIDSGETPDGQLYAVFAHVPGETLAQTLEREGRLGVREAVRLMTQVLDALAAAHAQGIVHRDLKPANLMLSGTGARRNALVLDFGLGGLAEGRRRAEWQTLTQTREFLGTPLYASPEQLAGEAATERSDLYAWGLIFLESLTGRHPFEGEGAVERLLTGGGSVEIPEWLREHRLGEVLEKVTARDAGKRDVSVEWLIEALDAVAGGGELPEAPEEAATPRPLSERGERRHLTVMFCDLVDSTGLAQRLDVEAYRRVVQAYQVRASEAIERYAGHVAQYLGDGILVYFGWPQAHEDDADRAVRAGRDIVRDLRTLNARLEADHGARLAVRVGIHTGPVVVGEMGGGEKQETLALGDTPTIASRLQGIADADTVVISDATQRLVVGRVISEDLGEPALKGIAEPIRAHRVTQTVSGPLAPAPLTPFVGRDEELGLLLGRFERAAERMGQTVLISGEAGIGKSRLVHQLHERPREAPHSWLECRCSPYRVNSALAPVIELVEQGLRLDDVAAPEEKVARVESALELAGFELAEAVPLFASFLSLRLPERYAPLEISPQLQRQKTLEALLSWGLALAERQPLVLLVEDLHWADPSTLEWLGLLIEQCPTAGVLLLLTHRPDFVPPWPARGHVLPIALSGLSRRQAKELVAAASGEALPGEVVERLAARSDGIPLFVEELAKDVAESSRDLTRSLSGLEIPETLHDSLMARLDRLGDAKQVAQVGAAIGREFEYGLLEAVAPRKEDELRDGLGRLVEAELVYQRGLPPEAVYTFKHALVQDVAYQSLLESQRRELHERIVDALEQRFPDRVAREPELLGAHCARAGRVEKAVGYYQEAAERATQRFAQAEAIAHLREAIALLAQLGESPEHLQRELQLQIALGSSLFAVEGGWVPEVERAYGRARELCGETRESPALFRALIGLSLFHYSRGELRIGRDLAEQALALADRAGEIYPRLVAHTRLGITLLYIGELRRGREHLRSAIALYDPSEHRARAAAWGQDWGTTAMSFGALAEWTLGHPDRARRLMGETVALAREGDAYSRGFALAIAAALHDLLGERTQARDVAERAIGIAEEQGFPTVLLIARSVHGWAAGGSRGIAEIQAALEPVAGTRNPSVPAWLLHLAATHLELGQTSEALAVAQAAIETMGEARINEHQLYETRGRILLRQGDSDAAEQSFRRALECARQQEARPAELQAATSLARLLRDRGERDEGRALLQPVYDWFTEGFDTQDLKDAKALLDEL